MQTVDTQVDCCTFTGFDNFFFHLFAYFRHYLFNTGRVDTSVGYQLMESQTGYFTANRVESRKNNRFRSIVNNDFNAGSSFQCTDIATFTSDNTSFDFIRLDMEYCNGILNSRFCSYPLDRLYYDTFRFLVSSQFRIIHDVVDIGLGLCFSFLFQ